MAYTLKHWRTALLVLLFKRRTTACPSSYRAIAVLSHVRKVIESAIVMAIRECYKFHESQLGFQTGTSTETAIMRHISNTKTIPLAMILDLKSAYDQVPKKKLYGIVTETQTGDIRGAIGFALQPMEIHTQGDTTEIKGTAARGVIQGSPLSTTLFNVYMDTLEGSLETKPATAAKSGHPTTLGESHDITFFADDVKLQAGSQRALQHLFDIATKWADE